MIYRKLTIWDKNTIQKCPDITLSRNITIVKYPPPHVPLHYLKVKNDLNIGVPGKTDILTYCPSLQIPAVLSGLNLSLFERLCIESVTNLIGHDLRRSCSLEVLIKPCPELINQISQRCNALAGY